MSPAVALVGGATQAHEITNPEFLIPSAGRTFDGRDRFGPAAAVLASGQAQLPEMGAAIDPATLTPTVLPLSSVEDERVSGTTWWVDHFGNVQTNVSPDELAHIGLEVGSTVNARLGPTHHELRYVGAYGDVAPGEGMIIVDSQGLVAISVREGRATDRYNLGDGRSVIFQAETS